MKDKAKIIIECSLSVQILLINFLSYALESYRLVVFVLGILYCILFFGLLLISVVKLLKSKFPFGIVFTIVCLVLLQNDSINSNYLVVENRFSATFVLLTIAIVAIVLIFVFLVNSKKTWKEDCLPFSVISIFLSLGIVLYGIFPIVNYSFDMTQTKAVYVTVIEDAGEENLKGAFFDTHYIYNVDAPDNLPITQISIDSDYKIDINTRVFIEYRKGVFCDMYKINYSKLLRENTG